MKTRVRNSLIGFSSILFVFLQAKEDLLTKKSESLFKMNNVDRKSEERMSEFRTMVKTAKTATVFSVKQLRSRLDSGKLLLDTYTVASLNKF